ncbi:uncharacterized protein LOC129586341 [Paramacrobiotus metropolitanus]|uniref:uncharacterized protein LOC129586341 n=1 Tax=Paramacrobiotus metropolitanus TaxID=2943436 RepID=UPI0024464548|nr:uncharacterized protein LOC129586341 [Paramacrobiotus metropolitanus]XP_055335497.1 uncharacterized protein LOC129586341 [Paramacrobiotus metropolitanus]XP_055335499.1 uncharacterized protein LOC129586341 [Paramacrobiotus metropolitanus]
MQRSRLVNDVFHGSQFSQPPQFCGSFFPSTQSFPTFQGSQMMFPSSFQPHFASSQPSSTTTMSAPECIGMYNLVPATLQQPPGSATQAASSNTGYNKTLPPTGNCNKDPENEKAIQTRSGRTVKRKIMSTPETTSGKQTTVKRGRKPRERKRGGEKTTGAVAQKTCVPAVKASGAPAQLFSLPAQRNISAASLPFDGGLVTQNSLYEMLKKMLSTNQEILSRLHKIEFQLAGRKMFVGCAENVRTQRTPAVRVENGSTETDKENDNGVSPEEETGWWRNGSIEDDSAYLDLDLSSKDLAADSEADDVAKGNPCTRSLDDF